MTIDFRNVEGSTADPVGTWPYEGLVSVLEHGGVRAWRPVFEQLEREPWGAVARSVEAYLAYSSEPALVSLFGRALARARLRREAQERNAVASRVRAAVSSSGRPARDFALAVGTSASRLSTYMTGRTMPSAAMLLRIEEQSRVDRSSVLND